MPKRARARESQAEASHATQQPDQTAGTTTRMEPVAHTQQQGQQGQPQEQQAGQQMRQPQPQQSCVGEGRRRRQQQSDPRSGPASTFTLRRSELSASQRLLVQLRCTSEEALASVQAAMSEGQRQAFEAGMDALERETLSTGARVEATFGLLQRVCHAEPKGPAAAAFGRHERDQRRELAVQQVEEVKRLVLGHLGGADAAVGVP